MIGPGGRVALYYAPAETDPLWGRANAWLGRDPARAVTVAQPPVCGLTGIAAEPARYGFHATLKPPMRLREGVTYAAFLDATRAVAAGITAFTLPPLVITDLFGFLALTESAPDTSLQAYADACIAGVDHLRAPPEADELARRRSVGLAAAEEANLRRWGYPYAFATWFFHMTLTRKLTHEEQAIYRPEADVWFEDVLDLPRRVNDVAVFVQPSADAAFVLTERISLSG